MSVRLILYTSCMRLQILSAFLIIAIPGTTLAASIPQGAQRVNLGMFTITAPCEADSSIESVTLRHSGLGDAGDIDRVYLAEGIRRISPARSFSGRENTIELRLRGLNIRSCTTRTFSILADFSSEAAAGSEHFVDVDSVRTASGTVTVAKQTAGAPVRPVPSSSGRITVEYRDLHGPVRYGNTRTIVRMLLSADGEEDQQITSITFTNEGSARNADLQRLRLFDGTTLLAPVVKSLDGDTLRFELDPPLSLSRNQEKLLTVKADVRASVKRTIQLIIDEPSDIEAMRQQRTR
jgi:hypothetical protein